MSDLIFNIIYLLLSFGEYTKHTVVNLFPHESFAEAGCYHLKLFLTFDSFGSGLLYEASKLCS